MEEHTKHYLISGRVQGVGFRRFTERTALTQFESRLRTGPAHGRVDDLTVSDLEAQNALEGFTTRKDGAQPWPEN